MGNSHKYRRIGNRGLITILIWAMISIAAAEELVISKPVVFIRDTVLAISFKIQNLLGEKEIKTINSGFTTTIKIKIELWEKGSIFHNLETTLEIIQKVSYDIWEKIYTLRVDKKNIVEFNNLKELKETLSREETALIATLQELNGKKKYFVRVYVDVESINEKQMQQINSRINSEFINLQKLLSIFVRHRTKEVKSYTQSDDFKTGEISK
ncbi:MAG: DUF4390 domain-containing protein [Nitrospirota bacterium]